MKSIKKDIINKNLLTKDQISVVKSMIIGSMSDGFTSQGMKVPPGFSPSANRIADKIIENSQKSFLAGSVFDTVINAKPKAKKNIKNKK
jgi:hypothetical protein